MEPLKQWFYGGPRYQDRPTLDAQDVAWTRTEPPTVFEINHNPQAQQQSLTFVVMSDTHNEHELINVPNADVLLHCGDYTNYNDNKDAVKRFNEWLGRLPHRHKVVIAGNHENSLKGKSRRAISGLLSNATFLWDQEIVIEGCKIYGAPYHIKRNGLMYWAGAFGLDEDEAAKTFLKIPADTDVLLTHAPPAGVLDLNYRGGCMGSASLVAAVQRVKPLVHCFGHNHDGAGVKRLAETTFINAASHGGGPRPRPAILFRLYYTPKATPSAQLKRRDSL